MPEIASELKFLAMTCSKLCFCERRTKNVIASGAAAWQSLALNKYSICTFLMPEIASELKFLAMTCSKLCYCERHTKNVIASGAAAWQSPA